MAQSQNGGERVKRPRRYKPRRKLQPQPERVDVRDVVREMGAYEEYDESFYDEVQRWIDLPGSGALFDLLLQSQDRREGKQVAQL